LNYQEAFELIIGHQIFHDNSQADPLFVLLVFFAYEFCFLKDW